MNQVQNELMHYGVLGMHWGKSGAGGAIKKAASGAKEWGKEAGKLTVKNAMHPIITNKANNESRLAGTKKDQVRRAMLYSKTKEVKDVNDRVDAMVSQKKEQNAVKTAHKQEIKAKTKELTKQASLGEKLIYNDATRKRAAKYILDNNMSVEAATKKAKGDAWRNTALFVGGYGALRYAALAKANQ